MQRPIPISQVPKTDYLLLVIGLDGSIEGRTRLEKILFLTRKEVLDRLRTPQATRFYQFTPYRFGPFSEDLYDDLEFLRDNGFIEIRGGSGSEVFSITPKGTTFLEQKVRKRLPPDVLEEVVRLRNKYARLSIQELIVYVYNRYPEYAVKSEIRESILGKVA
jgi:uncharacterized protein YwgA